MRRTKLFLAALAAASVAILASCTDNTLTNFIRLGSPIGSNTGTVNNGNCTWTAAITTTAALSSGGLVLTPGSKARVQVAFTGMTPANCVGGRNDWNFGTDNIAVATAAKVDTISADVTGVAAGSTLVRATFIANPNIQVTAPVTVNSVGTACVVNNVTITGTTNPLTPGGTVGMTAAVNSTPSGCAQQGVTWTSTTGVCTVSPNGLSVTVTAVAAGSCIVTATSKDDTGKSGTFTITVNGLPTVSFNFNPNSLCFSTAAGSTTSQTVTIGTAGIPNGTQIAVTSSNTSLITVSPSTFNAPSGTITFTRPAGSATGNVTITAASVSGGSSGFSIQVISGACPGTGNSIDYSPGGGIVTTTTQVTAACTVNGVANQTCPNQPFWTSDHPEALAVRGNSTQVVNGVTFYVGNTATITRIANFPGLAIQICVQWSLTQTTPSQCHTWTTQ